MGQQYSVPCTVRKLQEQRVQEGKYDFTFLDANKSADEGDVNINNIQKIEQIVNNYKPHQNKGTTGKPKGLLKLSPEHSSQSTSANSASSFTSKSDTIMMDNELSVMIMCEEMVDFNGFLANYRIQYNNNLIPSVVVPHPFLKRAMVVLQRPNNISNYIPEKLPQNHGFAEFVKDMKAMDNKNSYQILTQFLNKCNNEGLEYMGYYLDKAFKYHFVFYERQNQTQPITPNPLRFEMLDDLSEDDIELLLADAVDTQHKFKGIITLIPTKASPKPISFAIFEKTKLTWKKNVRIGVKAEAINADGPSLELCKKIEIGTQMDSLKLANLAIDHQQKLVHFIFNK